MSNLDHQPTPATGAAPAPRREPVPGKNALTSQLPAAPDTAQPRVVPVERVVRFSPTAVGASATQTITIQNRDDRRVGLDAIKPLVVEPFGDFQVELATSIALDPGESTAVTIRFRPTRAITSAQSYRLQVDRTDLTGTEFLVHGEGLDGFGGGYRSTADRLEAQDAQADVAEASHADGPLTKVRKETVADLDKWEKAAKTVNARTARWARDNWIDFLGKTGGDYAFRPSDAFATDMKLGLSAGLASLAEVENEALGLVVEQAVDSFVDFFVDKLTGTEEEPSAAEVAAKATRSVARVSIAKADEIDLYLDRADLVVADARSNAHLQVASSDSAEEINRWDEWATKATKRLTTIQPRADRSLSDRLLAEWVLQRAATPHHPAKGVNPTSWSDAREDLARSGALPTTERSDLFVKQCLHEWSTLGLAETNDLVRQIDRRRAQIESSMLPGSTAPEEIASAIVQQMSASDDIWFHHSSAPNVTADEFGRDYASDDLALGDPLSFAEPFYVQCHLQLRADGGAVYVERFVYHRDGHSDIIRSPR